MCFHNLFSVCFELKKCHNLPTLLTFSSVYGILDEQRKTQYLNENSCTLEAYMYKFKWNRQFSLSDFNQPLSLKVTLGKRWIKKCKEWNWRMVCFLVHERNRNARKTIADSSRSLVEFCKRLYGWNSGRDQWNDSDTTYRRICHREEGLFGQWWFRNWQPRHSASGCNLSTTTKWQKICRKN